MRKSCIRVEVIRATGAEVYLITSWVLVNPEGMKSLWKDRNMPGRLLPHIAPQAAISDRVEVFLEADDPADFNLSQKRYLVQTDPSVGIMAEDAARAMKLLR